MFDALRGQHGAIPPPCGKATKGRMKKAESALTVLSPCAEARGLLSQTRLRPNR
jgi:hypothetical protein